MAEILEEFDFKAGRTGSPEKYPWVDWFNGKIWKLDPKREDGSGDFPGQAEDFRTTCYSAAKRRKVQIRTSATKDGSLIVQKVSDVSEDAAAA
jgi:hypothetical protein